MPWFHDTFFVCGVAFRFEVAHLGDPFHKYVINRVLFRCDFGHMFMVFLFFLFVVVDEGWINLVGMLDPVMCGQVWNLFLLELLHALIVVVGNCISNCCAHPHLRFFQQISSILNSLGVVVNQLIKFVQAIMLFGRSFG